jgi:hypothetical protein
MADRTPARGQLPMPAASAGPEGTAATSGKTASPGTRSPPLLARQLGRLIKLQERSNELAEQRGLQQEQMASETKAELASLEANMRSMQSSLQTLAAGILEHQHTSQHMLQLQMQLTSGQNPGATQYTGLFQPGQSLPMPPGGPFAHMFANQGLPQFLHRPAALPTSSTTTSLMALASGHAPPSFYSGYPPPPPNPLMPPAPPNPLMPPAYPPWGPYPGAAPAAPAAAALPPAALSPAAPAPAASNLPPPVQAAAPDPRSAPSPHHHRAPLQAASVNPRAPPRKGRPPKGPKGVPAPPSAPSQTTAQQAAGPSSRQSAGVIAMNETRKLNKAFTKAPAQVTHVEILRVKGLTEEAIRVAKNLDSRATAEGYHKAVERIEEAFTAGRLPPRSTGGVLHTRAPSPPNPTATTHPPAAPAPAAPAAPAVAAPAPAAPAPAALAPAPPAPITAAPVPAAPPASRDTPASPAADPTPTATFSQVIAEEWPALRPAFQPNHTLTRTPGRGAPGDTNPQGTPTFHTPSAEGLPLQDPGPSSVTTTAPGGAPRRSSSRLQAQGARGIQ